MARKIGHRIAGYDEETDQLVVRYELPASLFPTVKKFAEVGPHDPDATLGAYPLIGDRAKRALLQIGEKLNPRLEYFLEPFADA